MTQLLLRGLVVLFLPAIAQSRDLDADIGNPALLTVSGTYVPVESVDPILRKSFAPWSLHHTYRWIGWKETNYAQEHYLRYVDPDIEGEPFYDVFGNFVTRGWLIYDWRQRQPRQFGSSVLEDLGRLRRLVIARDEKGSHHYALTIGDGIRTTLTPLTFSKPAFDGMQLDVASDRVDATMLLSRINLSMSGPMVPTQRTNCTNLFGGRIVARIGEFVRLGATVVDAHQAHTQREFGTFHPLKGVLTTEQNGAPVSLIAIRLSDDSPEDREGGAAFFSAEIELTDVSGRRFRGSDAGLHPEIKGGIPTATFLTADGGGTITLMYHLEDPDYTGPPPEELRGVQFQLEVGNDYRVEIASDRQTDRDGGMVFLPVARAEGNVRDLGNRKTLVFDYGLQTANALFGLSLEVTDVWGFDLQGEIVLNRPYFQYPNPNLKDHHTFSRDAYAGYLNAAYGRYPWIGFCELFHTDPEYSTSSFLNHRGTIDYADEHSNVYEFVDDNDDLDRYPDWRRFPEQYGDEAVLPGWDENNDGISDFNQNDHSRRWNLIPDYEEPFLRYGTDRPEFLFGMDMNHNGWIDRLENDDLPDYPYRRDHRGYNVYAGTHLGPDVKLLAGQLREHAISSGRGNLSSYALFTLDRSRVWGGYRIGELFQRVKDIIPDDVFRWEWPLSRRRLGRGGVHYPVEDSIAFRDAWVNTAYLEFTREKGSDFHWINRIKWKILRRRDVRRTSTFLGMINKVDGIYRLGDMEFQPRWKSEYLLERSDGSSRRHELREIVSLFARMGFEKWHKARTWRKTGLEAGVELMRVDRLGKSSWEGQDDALGVTFLVQMTTFTDFLGYRMIVTNGLRVNRQDYVGALARATGMAFTTVYMGSQE